MERSDWVPATVLLVLLGAQLLALWLGLRLRPCFGWLGQGLAGLVPSAAALVLLYAVLASSAPCPPGFELECGEGMLSLACTGLACAASNLFLAIPVQLGVRGHLRRREEPGN